MIKGKIITQDQIDIKNKHKFYLTDWALATSSGIFKALSVRSPKVSLFNPGKVRFGLGGITSSGRTVSKSCCK